MFEINIAYTDYNDVERNEKYAFNISRAELLNWEKDTKGGLELKLNKIIESKDPNEIVGLFTEILQRAYGVKSVDGKRFMKSEEIWKTFEESEAYSELIMRFLQDSDYAAEFINAVIPKLEGFNIPGQNMAVVK